MMAATEIYWDPYDVEIDIEPYALWRRMRDEAPVYRNDKYDFWAFTRFEDVQWALRTPEIFTSTHGTALELMGNDMSAVGTLIFMDPPEHSVVRSLFGRAFTPKRIAALEEPIRAICAEYLDAQVGSGGFDYLADFGTHLPSRVISQLLGVPAEERADILTLINKCFTLEGDKGFINETAVAAMFELQRWVMDALAERRSQDRDDMLSVIAKAEVELDGVTRRLTDEEAANFGLLLATAGTETVARLLGWSAVTLAAHPDQRAELVNDYSLIPNAIEEMLRFEAPIPLQGRTVVTPVELHGVQLEAGAKILLSTGSAGRDERIYPDPDRFDIHRRFEQHVSFGVGAHYCLGAALARLEGRIAYEETFKRFPTWEVDHVRVERLHTSTVRGHRLVPVTVS